MIEKDPASFQKLLDGYFAAGEKLDKKEALRVAEEYLGQDAATLETSLDWISYQAALQFPRRRSISPTAW